MSPLIYKDKEGNYIFKLPSAEEYKRLLEESNKRIEKIKNELHL